jgi:hypothetical protein
LFKSICWLALYLFLAFNHVCEAKEQGEYLCQELKREFVIKKVRKEETMKTQVMTTVATQQKEESNAASRAH